MQSPSPLKMFQLDTVGEPETNWDRNAPRCKLHTKWHFYQVIFTIRSYSTAMKTFLTRKVVGQLHSKDNYDLGDTKCKNLNLRVSMYQPDKESEEAYSMRQVQV